MEEIGCHFKYESFSGNLYHDTSLLLSSGRNCLKYIIRERKISTLYLPYFLCESLSDIATKENVEIIFYHINEEMLPVGIKPNKLNENSYLYFVNYYGILKDKIREIIDIYKYVIIDNTHDFFDNNKYNVDVIYNYRKFFGVPDGACIVSDDLTFNPKYEKGKSLNKIIEMVSRDETGEYFHYPTFKEADKYFANEDLCYMSNFTQNYLKAINYQSVLEKRKKNYEILRGKLSELNQKVCLAKFKLNFMYPLYCDQGVELRKHLLQKNIYSQLLWPNIEWNGASTKEIELARKMVLLPIDQRYSELEMNYISEAVHSFMSK